MSTRLLLLFFLLQRTAARMAENHTDYFNYFAYGSNLLQERIRVQVKGAEFVSTGFLPGYRVFFLSHGKRWNGAVASIEENKDEETWGCVWRVPHTFAAELDKQEHSYHRLTVPVHVGSSIVQCRIYQFTDTSQPRTKPSPHYKTVIVAGAREHNLPAAYIEKLDAWEDNGWKGKIELDLEAIKHINKEP